MVDEQEVFRFLGIAFLIAGMIGPITFFEPLFDKRNKVGRKRAFIYLYCWIFVLVLLFFIGNLKLALIALCTGSVIGFSTVIISKIFYKR
jgi:hypothetical protein